MIVCNLRTLCTIQIDTDAVNECLKILHGWIHPFKLKVARLRFVLRSMSFILYKNCIKNMVIWLPIEELLVVPAGFGDIRRCFHLHFFIYFARFLTRCKIMNELNLFNAFKSSAVHLSVTASSALLLDTDNTVPQGTCCKIQPQLKYPHWIQW